MMKRERHSSYTNRLLCISMASIFILISFVPPASGSNSGNTVAASVPNTPIKAIVNKTLEIEHIIRQVGPSMMGDAIQTLQDFKTRYAYRGDKCNAVAEYIHSVFQRNGLVAEYDPFEYAGYKFRNVVGTKYGTSTSNAQVIISAHYDSISNSAWVDAPGADDNGSGIAGLLAAAEILSDYDFNYTIKFIAFGAEELGLKGSYHYVGQAAANGDNITGVINLDMIANNAGNHTKVNIYHSTLNPSASLINHVISTLNNYSHIIPMTIWQAGSSGNSDHQPFGGICDSVHLMEGDFSSYYHTTNDRLQYLNLTYGANVTQIAMASLAGLAQLNSTDNMPPSHGPGFPPNGGYGQENAVISLMVRDPAGIDIPGLEMRVNGAPVVPSLIKIPLGYNVTYSPPLAFPDGQIVNVSVKASDTKGKGFNHSWEYTVDAMYPEPPANLTIHLSSVEMDKQGVVMVGGPSSFDIKHVLAPSVIFQDGEYKMWYAGYDNSKYQICYANSTNGLNWTKHGIVLQTGSANGPDGTHVSSPDVIYDGEYKMWYSGYNASGWRILYANSTDGLNWTKHGPVIEAWSLGPINNMDALYSSVIKNTEYKMWYTAIGDGVYSIIYANSSNGLNWTQHPADVSPRGASIIHGDAIIAYPDVVYHGGEYRMWYSRYDSHKFRLMYANSSDGMLWNDQGLAIDASGTPGDYDYFRAAHCSALVMGNETKVWYSGYNNVNWRIMYANLTPASAKTDLTLAWAPSTSPDVTGYEVYRESRPSAFTVLERSKPAFYSSVRNRTVWASEVLAYSNSSVYGPVTAADSSMFYLPEDDILEISLFILMPGGAWISLVNGVDFNCDYVSGRVEILSPYLIAGSTVYASFDYSATRALQTTGTSTSDIGAGDMSIESYFYIVIAVDRVGHRTRLQTIAGKQATRTESGWNLVSNPLIPVSTTPPMALEGIDWKMARTWVNKPGPHWTVNQPAWPPHLNTLDAVNDTDGIWFDSAVQDLHVSAGQVHNITYDLKIGWNLVSYPYFESKSLSETLAALPWDRVEVFDPQAPYLLREMNSGNLMPGQGFWVHLTADSIWGACNY